MGDEGEKQIEIWKVKRVSTACLMLLLWCWCILRVQALMAWDVLCSLSKH